MGAFATTVPSGTSTVSTTLSTPGPVKLMGFTAAESAGSPGLATFTIRDASATGLILVTGAMLASSNVHEWFGPMGVVAPSGIVVVVRPTGTSTVTFYTL